MKVDAFLKKRKSKRTGFEVFMIHEESFYKKDYAHFGMGLLYMATILKDAGFNVRCLGIHEQFFLTVKHIRRMFLSSRNPLVGFYTVSDNIYQVREFAANVKRWQPGATVVVGGPLAATMGEKILEWPAFDIAVTGEGEFIMKKLAEWKIRGEGSLEDIDGIIYTNENGEIVKTKSAEPITDLDALPFPDRDLIGFEKNFHVVSGRGCPYNCIFCFQGVHGLKFRYRSAQNVFDEIKLNIEKYDSVSFDIIDDTFISKPSRVNEIAGMLENYRNETGRRFVFFCQGRADIIDKHPEMLENMRRAGMVRLQIGIESGDPETLRIYEKRVTVEQVKSVVRKTFETGGMCIVGNLILGGPFENEETFNASLELTKELIRTAPGVFEVGKGFMGPYPGTPIGEFPEKFGLKIIEDEFKKGLTLSDVHAETEHLDKNDLRRLEKRFETEVIEEMEKNLSRIPRQMIQFHFNWADEFGLFTNWYIYILSKRPVIKQYYDYLKSFRFDLLAHIPPEELTSWRALRIAEKREYSDDGKRIILPPTTVNRELVQRDEILIYELSAGKITIGEMVAEYKRETGSKKPDTEIMADIFMPIFKNLEDTYHVIFYR